jgi:hypothetical protein
MSRRRTLIVLGLVAVSVPASALGVGSSTAAPTPAQKAAIIKAFGDPKSASSCLDVLLAASNRNYATVRFRTAKGCRRWVFNGVDVEKQMSYNRWKVVFEGSSYRCPVAHVPRRVQRDLAICR